MKKKSLPARAGLFVSIPSFLLLALTPLAGNAFVFPTPGVGACFGWSAAPYFADVINTVPGNELIVMNANEAVQSDGDMDGFSAVRAAVIVRVLDRTGAQQWRSEQLKLFSADVATVFPPSPGFPGTYTVPGLFSNTYAALLYAGGIICYGTAFAVEAGGQQYLAVMLGFITHTGATEATAVDQSKVNVWILNAATGEIVFVHKLRPKANRFLSAFALSGVGKLDADADDELVVVWALPSGNGVYKMLFESYDILDGTSEESFSFFTSNVRTFAP